MPIFLPEGLPAIEILASEGIKAYGYGQLGPRPHVDIALVNIMPKKQETELDIARVLSNSRANVKLHLAAMHGHASKNTPAEHIERFYIDSREMTGMPFDGLIVTGAPVELLPFTEVDYWEELCRVIVWARSAVKSAIYICWGAQAALYLNHGICTERFGSKLFGVFRHEVSSRRHPITTGFDDIVHIPHSRHTGVDANALRACPSLDVAIDSEQAGPYMAIGGGGKEIYVTGHIEYSALTLDAEYKRDLAKGLDISMPQNYYLGDDARNAPPCVWRSHAFLMFTNWVDHYLPVDGDAWQTD